MELNDQSPIPWQLSERLKRRLINQMAHHLASRSYERERQRLQGQLDNAEMQGRETQLLIDWQRQLLGQAGHSAGV